MGAGGLTIVDSARGFGETLHAFLAALERRQVQVFAVIDHAANAAGAGLELAPTTVVVFGAAKAGTPLMQARQTLGLDLPLRALVYEAEGRVRIAWREPLDILAAQGVPAEGLPQAAGMTALLKAVAQDAAGG